MGAVRSCITRLWIKVQVDRSWHKRGLLFFVKLPLFCHANSPLSIATPVCERDERRARMEAKTSCFARADARSRFPELAGPGANQDPNWPERGPAMALLSPRWSVRFDALVGYAQPVRAPMPAPVCRNTDQQQPKLSCPESRPHISMTRLGTTSSWAG